MFSEIESHVAFSKVLHYDRSKYMHFCVDSDISVFLSKTTATEKAANCTETTEISS